MNTRIIIYPALAICLLWIYWNIKSSEHECGKYNQPLTFQGSDVVIPDGMFTNDEPAYKVAKRRDAQDRERRIEEMKEAFVRAIRETGLSREMEK